MPNSPAEYTVKVTNAAGSVISTPAYLNTFAYNALGVYTTCQDTPIQIYHTARGVDVTYQWYSSTSASTVSGTPIPGATSDTYSPPVDTPWPILLL
jgi:hypothetical protein